MKYFILLFLISAFGYGQKLTYDEQAILSLKLLEHKQTLPNRDYTKSIIGDSIIVSSRVLSYYIKNLADIKQLSIDRGFLTAEEAKEIFDHEYIQPSGSSEYWSLEQLPNIEIVLFDKNKYTTAVTIKKSEKIGLGTFNILSVSRPMIRQDRKYAVIEISHEHYGGVLSIYKNTPNGWVHYKDIQLYYI